MLKIDVKGDNESRNHFMQDHWRSGAVLKETGGATLDGQKARRHVV